MKFWVRLCPLGIAVLASSPVLAAADWQVYGGVLLEYDDNPQRQDNGSDADLEQRLTVGGLVNHRTRTTLLNLDYRWLNTMWLDDSFDNRNTLQGYLNFNWMPVNFFSFYLRNTREDLIGSSYAADTQDNRAVRSTLETGVVFTAQLTAVDTLNFSPSYTSVHFGGNTGVNSGVDSERTGFLAYWAHRFSPNDQFTVNAFGQRINFDQGDSPVAVDFDRAQAFLGYQTQLARLSYNLQFGYTWMWRDDTNLPPEISSGNNDFSGPMYRAGVGYEYENHSLQLRAYRDVTDTSIGSSGYNVGASGGVTGDPNSTNSLAIVNLTNIDLIYDLKFGDQRWNWGIDYHLYKQDVKGRLPGPSFGTGGAYRPQRDEVGNGIRTNLGYTVNPLVSVWGFGHWLRADYPKVPILTEDESGEIFTADEVDQTSTTLTLGITATFNLFRYGTLDVGIARESRQTDVFYQSFEIVDIGPPLDFGLRVNNEQDFVSHRIFVNFRAGYPNIGTRGAMRNFSY